jgi:aminopeptidase N
VFEKAATVIRMFYETLTPNVFEKGIKKYLTTMSFKSASSDDFYRALQSAYDEDISDIETLSIKDVFRTWESQAGYPVVRVEKIDNKIILTQKRFTTNNDNDESIYAIPITYSTRSNPMMTRKLWMTTRSIEINDVVPAASSDDWIIFNIQQVGYYRVDYGRELWNAIIDGYSTTEMHRINRITLHDEMFIAWKSLRSLKLTDVLTFVKVLKLEHDGIVWESAASYLESINEFLQFSDVQLNFHQLMHDVLQPHINNANGKAASESDKLINEVRKWSRISMYEPYLMQEQMKLIQQMESNEEGAIIDYCSAFRYANASIYTHYVDQVINSNTLINIDLIHGLGCTLNATLLRKFFLDIMPNGSELSDFVIMDIIYATMEASIVGLESVMELISQNIRTIELM